MRAILGGFCLHCAELYGAGYLAEGYHLIYSVVWALRESDAARQVYLRREGYDSDSLITCRTCDRECCYHRGDSGNAMGQRCLDKQRASQPSE